MAKIITQGAVTPTGQIARSLSQQQAVPTLQAPDLLYPTTDSAVGVDAAAAIAGAQATAAAGAIAAKGDASAATVGTQAASAPGTLAAKGDASAASTGAQITSAPGAIAAKGDAGAAIAGAAVVAGAGAVAGAADGLAAIAGAAAGFASGQMTASGSTAPEVINGLAEIAGAAVQAFTGAMDAAGDAAAQITGAQAQAMAGEIAGEITVPGVQPIPLMGGAPTFPYGNPWRRKAKPAPATVHPQVHLNAAALLPGAEMKAHAGNMSATGDANTASTKAFAHLEAGLMAAKGVRNPTDVDLLLLLLECA